jgi:hypothetical protein
LGKFESIEQHVSYKFRNQIGGIADLLQDDSTTTHRFLNSKELNDIYKGYKKSKPSSYVLDNFKQVKEKQLNFKSKEEYLNEDKQIAMAGQ